MRIERLELTGFKSFADRTIFNLHPGITCIVGPNGCGKSNVVDAFRWVLGEQSAKSLRGEKMEEVIFNGSVSKKPRGMADVTMVVSSLNGTEQTDGEGSSDTASVTRRLYRSGDSEYMLNKNQCRLKDIRDLFLDTGLEVKSYSIFEQDRIAEILNAKPQDRRFLIEEVAGVMKYNVRKKEAQAKLESSRTNLQRIDDIVAEVKKQINILDRLAKKAERYKKLSSEIRDIELKIAKRDYQALKESFEKILSEYKTLKEEESLKRAELTKIENQTETKRLELLEREKALEQLQLKFQNLEKEIAELERIIAVSRTDRDNLKEYLTKLYSQVEELDIKKSETIARHEELNAAEATLLSDIGDQKDLLTEKTDFLRSVEEGLSDKEELLEEKRRELFGVSEELSNLRNDLSRLQSSLEDLNRRESSSLQDIEDSKKVLTDIDSSIKEVESSLLNKNNDLLLLNEKKVIFINELSANRNRIEDLRDAMARSKEELASYTSRLESLKEIVFDRPTRELLSEGLNFHLIASISDVIEVDAEYEKAIESALSEKVNSFILSSFEDIEIAISSLKEKGLSRTAFIPLRQEMRDESQKSIVNPESSSGQQSLMKTNDQCPMTNDSSPHSSLITHQGVIGEALSYVRTEEEFSNVVKNLFDNIFIVRDLKTALNLRSRGHKLFFVTIDGEIVEPSGAVIGGEGKGIFRRKREIRELEVIIADKKASIERMQDRFNSIQQIIENKESGLKQIESTIVDIEKESSLLKLTAENYREEKERINRKLAYLNIEIEQIIREKESVKKLINEKEASVQSVDLRRSDIEHESTSLQDEISQIKTKLEGHRTEVTDIRLSLTSFKEKIESLNKERETILKNIEELIQKKEFMSEEISSVKSRISQREREMAEYEEKIKSLVSVADELRLEISEKKEAIETENEEVLQIEHGLKALRQQIDSLSHSISGLDVDRAEHRFKIENLCGNIRQNYGSELETIEIEPLIPEDEQRLIELTEKVQELGPVNLGTLEEYEELRTRYEFLIGQQEDLNKSIAGLEEAITRINSTTRRRLREAFDALKTKFSEVFLTLFGGGRAELVMTDESNILETGIDIIAQPPGKKLQNINLLSGGEKALTALSLLFASFLVKPTPLCIMDEADATLDESNTERFARMLQELSRDTQFIVVTHNRTTMSIADYIYGITMEEAGVSKVISMQLVEA
ncbi:MAG: chromosome segregation protein SMC [Nitrospirae bacterium]|nr:chromosome segregation protein SMC [Nitrospirota bacterium]